MPPIRREPEVERSLDRSADRARSPERTSSALAPTRPQGACRPRMLDCRRERCSMQVARAQPHEFLDDARPATDDRARRRGARGCRRSRTSSNWRGRQAAWPRRLPQPDRRVLVGAIVLGLAGLVGLFMWQGRTWSFPNPSQSPVETGAEPPATRPKSPTGSSPVAARSLRPRRRAPVRRSRRRRALPGDPADGQGKAVGRPSGGRRR
jgi:hypothetical protein